MRGLRSLVAAVLAFAIVAASAIFLLRPDNSYRPLPFAKPPVAKGPPAASTATPGHPPDADSDRPQQPSHAQDGEPAQPPGAQNDAPAKDEPQQTAPDSQDHAAASFADFSHSDRPMMPADDPLCARMPGRNSSIALIVKTGATESFGKIPTQLQTILRCVPDLLIFSDMQQTIAGVLVRDSLDTVLDNVKQSPGFALYRAQQDCLVSQGDCMRHNDKAKDGWAMDKYKNIHIAEKAYALRPARDWYVVIDADTYLFWTTLVAFLERLDPDKKLLLGSIAHYKDFPFAHGGSGYIMSRGAMDDFVGGHPGIGNAYDERVADECCGDWMFSKAVSETSGIAVTQAAPTINGDKIWDLAFGPDRWCHPLATMHHVGSEEMSLFWEFEMKRQLSAENMTQPNPVLIRDMYLEYFLPRATGSRDDWNNVSKDVIYLNRTATEEEESVAVPEAKKKSDIEKIAHASPENCRAACKANADCFQYSYVHEGKCSLGKSFKIGYPASPAEERAKRMTSGWLTERIKTWIEKQGECEAQWPDVGKPRKGFLGFLEGRDHYNSHW